MSVATLVNDTEKAAKQKELDSLFTGRPGAVQIAPEGWCLPTPFQDCAKDIKEFSFKENDTIVMTVPKCGTTWALEVVWTMKNNPDLNHPSAHLPLNTRCPILELDIHIETQEKKDVFFEKAAGIMPEIYESCGTFLEVLCKYPEPRTIKTHLPFQLVSDTALSKAKVVYVIRDPRDACISYYHHCTIFKFDYFGGTLDQFIDAFLDGTATYSPYWPHVKAAWERRHHPNLHVVFYEHMKKHPKEELHKLSKFLGLQISESQIEKIVEYTSFEAMKKRDQHVVFGDQASSAMNTDTVKEKGGFFRQGTSGGWKNVLNEQQKAKFETWIKENCPDEKILQNFVNH
ncbi:Sulfotransferase domain [Trinorchestia longiramus]|nr:Sulfotransferase domain [Trinorchestia longiramus]